MIHSKDEATLCPVQLILSQDTEHSIRYASQGDEIASMKTIYNKTYKMRTHISHASQFPTTTTQQ